MLLTTVYFFVEAHFRSNMPFIIMRYFFYGLKQELPNDTEFENDTTVIPKFWNHVQRSAGKHYFTLMRLLQLVDYFAR